jgi:SAM-dependent methyltransferase
MSSMPAIYDQIGQGYRRHRQPDPRIAAQVGDALGDARTLVNVGAGAGSYEPMDREVVAVEPSATMIAQRPQGAARVIQASAESLPFADGSFDAAMAILTIHHWNDRPRGLAELRRVARHRVVILTHLPDAAPFWLTDDYVPEITAMDRGIFPPIAEIESVLGPARVTPVPVPHDCVDGFLGAYWRRPEAYLDPTIRASISGFAKLPSTSQGIERLRADLASGEWERRNGSLRRLESVDLGYRLVVCE